MTSVLSIDWDYFIGATADERLRLFPDGGNENLSPAIQSIVWASRYASSAVYHEIRGEKSLSDISVNDSELDMLFALIRGVVKDCTTFSVAESHKDIVNLLPKRCSVINVDFHHDCFTTTSCVDCGNWARLKVEDGTVQNLIWVSCKDSYYEDGVPVNRRHTSISEVVPLEGVDHIFMCRSGMWSPPHLDYEFINAVLRIDEILNKDTGTEGLYKMVNRWHEGVKRAIVTESELIRGMLK